MDGYTIGNYSGYSQNLHVAFFENSLRINMHMSLSPGLIIEEKHIGSTVSLN